MPDLTFVPTDEIIEELKRRFSSGVLHTVHDVPGNEEDEECRRLVYWGGWVHAIGLADLAKTRLYNEFPGATPDGREM